MTKTCEHCGSIFNKPLKFSATQWAKSRFCCSSCSGKHNIRVAKGGWNKFRHGEGRASSRTTEWRSWWAMRSRCGDPKHKHYATYGGRGITVCDHWTRYENFIQDMGRKPTPRHTLDRIDGDAGYSPENCRWATRGEQSSNLRTNRRLTYNSETHSLAEWSRRSGIHPATIGARLRRGWSVERALGFEIWSGAE